MKFSIARDALIKPLNLVAGVVERRQTLPILSNVLLVLEGKTLSLTGTDLEVELVGRVELDSPGVDGEVTVPARKLVDICKSLPEGSTMEFALEAGKATVKAGRSRFTLSTLPAADFPAVEGGAGSIALSLAQTLVKQLIDGTAFAMAQQDVRYFFNGILFEIVDGVVRLVATNGQRLATSYLESGTGPGNQQFIVPRKAISELSRILAGLSEDLLINLEFTANHLTLEVPGTRLVTKLIDATYPDYSRAIPSGGDKVMLADRQLLKDALSRTAILSNELYRNVRLILLPDRLDMHANNPQQEEAEESLAVTYQGESIEIGFNVSYLIEALSAMSGSQVRMTLSDSSSACLLEDVDEKECLYVISPMML